MEMKQLEQEQRVVALITFENASKAYVGDSLNLERGETEAGEPIIFVDRGTKRLGNLPPWLDLDTETWAAYVAKMSEDGELFGHVTAVRLIPFEVEPCGCCRNFGGYHVRYCDKHGAEVDAEFKHAKCEHGRKLGHCAECTREGNEVAREERRMIDDAQQL